MNEIIRLQDFRELYRIVSHQQESTAANDDNWIVVGFQDNFYSVHLLQGKVLLCLWRKNIIRALRTWFNKVSAHGIKIRVKRTLVKKIWSKLTSNRYHQQQEFGCLHFQWRNDHIVVVEDDQQRSISGDRPWILLPCHFEPLQGLLQSVHQW